MGRNVARVRGADMLLLVSGAIFSIATFLPWYRFRFAGSVAVQVGSFGTNNAWQSGGLGVLAALLGIGALIVAIAVATGSGSPGPQAAGLLAFALSLGALFFTLLRFLFRPAGSGALERLSRGLLQVHRSYGLLVALIAAVIMAVAGYQKYREHAV